METTNAVNQTIKPTLNVLKLTFGIVPIVAGLDKFTNLLSNWGDYIHPGIVSISPIDANFFMMIIGIVEISAGVLVLVKPKIGGIVVAAWLTLIALTLLTSGKFLDVAVRDLVMAICVFSMVRIMKVVE